MRRKELFYYVTWGSNVTRDVHWCVTGFYQQIEISNIANQIYRFTIDYGKFILKLDRNTVDVHALYFLNNIFYVLLGFPKVGVIKTLPERFHLGEN